jgi:hypothetical protein
MMLPTGDQLDQISHADLIYAHASINQSDHHEPIGTGRTDGKDGAAIE